MKLITSIILLSFGFMSCKEEKTFDAFDFSFGNTFETDFSIKFTHSDTVFIRENWSYYDIDENVSSPKSKTNYFSILTKSQKTDLNKLLESIEFSKFDTLYYDDYSDGSEYKFHIKRNNLEKTIYLHSKNPPKELDSLATWIYLTKRKLKLVKTNKIEIYRSKIPMPEPPPLYINNN